MGTAGATIGCRVFFDASGNSIYCIRSTTEKVINKKLMFGRATFCYCPIDCCFVFAEGRLCLRLGWV